MLPAAGGKLLRSFRAGHILQKAAGGAGFHIFQSPQRLLAAAQAQVGHQRFLQKLVDAIVSATGDSPAAAQAEMAGVSA